ncbi:acyl-CoA dehydrogenase family protein [Brevibacterium album]|uniref:acyl-CoA dehydrogenase family protein n=1 Tax=Brevibacterium album TaxID=417948 RepID=UPI000407339F|nr:acyl-CoA dehydrogenase family protein [Brevibacterium album]
MSSPQTRAKVRELLDRQRASGTALGRIDSWLRAPDAEFSRALGAAGLLGMTWPVEHGGRGASNVERLAVTEELLRAGAPVTAHWIGERQIGPAVLRAGTDELKEQVLPGIVAGEFVVGLGMSEPESGSDLASVRTRATPVEGGWRLSGHKIWTTMAHRATHMYILARTADGERKHEGLSEFLIDMDAPGITVTPIVDLAGEHHFNEVRYEDVFVPADRLIGAEGGGWRQVVEQLSFERGGPERALSTWALLPALLAEPGLRRDEGAVRELGQIAAVLAGLRQAFYETARAMDAGGAPVRLAAASKLLGNRFEKDLIGIARRLAPGAGPRLRGLIRDAQLASPGFGIRGGAEDVLLGIIAKLELPRDLTQADPAPRIADPELAELAQLAVQVGGGLQEADRSAAGEEALRAQIAELGWETVAVPEAAGGSGGTLAEALALVRGLARTGRTGGLPESLAAAWAGTRSGAAVPILNAAVLVGAAEAALELTVRYVIGREQFGAPLAALPAVKSQVATMRVQLDLAVAALNRASAIAEGPGADGDAGTAADPASAARFAALAAFALASQAGTLIAEQAHQLHGAIGVTAEYPLHHLTTLIWATRDGERAADGAWGLGGATVGASAEAGDGAQTAADGHEQLSEHAALVELGEAVLAGGEPFLWDVLTDTSPETA